MRLRFVVKKSTCAPLRTIRESFTCHGRASASSPLNGPMPWGLSRQRWSPTLAACVRELKVAAAIRDGELDVVVRALRLWKGRVAAAGNRANTAEPLADEALGEILRLRDLVRWLNGADGGKRGRTAKLVDA